MVTCGSSLVSLDYLLSHGGMGSPFSGCCQRCCGLWLCWKLYCYRWSLIWWSLPTVQLLQNSPHCFVNFVLFACLTCMCFLCAVCPCVFLVCTHAQGCLHKWLNLKVVLIQEHISHTRARAHAQYNSIGCTIHTNVAPTHMSCSQSFSFCTTTLTP